MGGWLAGNGAGPPARNEGSGGAPRRAWLAKVREAGWASPRWSTEGYGRELASEQARIVERAFAAVGAPGAGQDRRGG